MGARRNGELTALEAWAARRAKYPSTAHCLHPACVNSCDYALARGRRQLFCSLRCAKNYSAQRLSLVSEIRDIEDALQAAASPYSALATELRHHHAHARWLLARFGGLPSTSPPDYDAHTDGASR